MARIQWMYSISWLLVALVQVTVLENGRINGAVPNLVTTLLVLAIFIPSERIVIWQGVLFGGLALDLFHTGPFGLALMSLALAISAIWLVYYRYLRHAKAWLIVLFATLASLVYDLIAATFIGVLSLEMVARLLGNAMYSAVVALIVLAGMFLNHQYYSSSTPLKKG